MMLHWKILCMVFICLLVLPFTSLDLSVDNAPEKTIDETEKPIEIKTDNTIKDTNINDTLTSEEKINHAANETVPENVTTDSEKPSDSENRTSENAHVKSKYNCVEKNYTEGEVSSVVLVNVSQLLTTISSIKVNNNTNTSSSENFCVLVLFYAKWCHFSAALAPHFNALGRIYPNMDILAIDGGTHNSLNTRYGIVGAPTVVLFSNKRLVARLNETENNLQELITFVKQSTGIDHVGNAEVLSQDFDGPIPCIAVQQTDYVLWISWIFIICCLIFGFSKSSLCHWIIESIQVNWQEAEAQHEHVD